MDDRNEPEVLGNYEGIIGEKRVWLRRKKGSR
jgi:hypothetical protein